MLRIAKFSGTASGVDVVSLFEATSIQLLIDLRKRLLLRGRFGGMRRGRKVSTPPQARRIAKFRTPDMGA
jgi:predicted metal-binding protein